MNNRQVLAGIFLMLLISSLSVGQTTDPTTTKVTAGFWVAQLTVTERRVSSTLSRLILGKQELRVVRLGWARRQVTGRREN